MAALTDKASEPTRRDFIYLATGATAVVGGASVVWPLIMQMNPDKATIAAGAPVEVDISPVQVGQEIKIFWRGKPIYIRNRSPEEIKAAEDVDAATLRDPQKDSDRVQKGKEQWLVLVGICTHLGCVPIGYEGEYKGFFCPCHGSVYDTSGRIRQGPAPLNLPVPPYAFLSDTKIQIG